MFGSIKNNFSPVQNMPSVMAELNEPIKIEILESQN